MKSMPACVVAEAVCRKVSQARFLLTLARLKARVPLIITALLLVGAIIAGVVIDMRWLIVGLMTVFIILPGVMAMLYFAYALSPRCLPCAHSHRVLFLEDALIVGYSVSIPAGEGEQEITRHVELRIPYSDITRQELSLDTFMLVMKNPFGLLLIPLNACDSVEKAVALCRRYATNT